MSIAIKRSFTIPSTSAIGASEIYVTSSVASTSFGTGALNVVGGVGIGGSLWTSNFYYSSISGVGLSAGLITGKLSGTATSAQVLSTTTDNSSTLYILGTRSNGGFAGTSIYVTTGISALGNTLTATTFSGNATTSTSAGTAGTATNAGSAGTSTSAGTAGTATNAGSAGTSTSAGTAGTATNAGSAGTSTSAGTAGTATNAGSAGTSTSAGTAGTATNAGSAGTSTSAGTAGTATNAANANVVLDTTSTIYLTGSRSNSSIGSTPVYVLSGVSAIGNTLNASGVNITGSTASTSTTSGALIVTGGVGIGGSLWTSTTNFSSISGVGHSNSIITSGVWSGTAISAVNGGTGNVSYTTGDILYASSSTTLGKIIAGTAGSVLTSAGSGSTPYWAVATAGSATGLTLNGLTATTQYFATSISGSGFTIGSTGSTHTYYIALAGNASTGLISGTAQTIFGLKTFASGIAITSGTASTNTTTGDLVVSGGVGIGDSLYVAGAISVNTGTSGLLLRKLVSGNYGAIYSTGITPSATNYSMITDGASVNFNGTNGVYFNINNTNKIQVTTNNINIVPTAGSSSTSTGAFTVAGGVGIGGSLWTSTDYYSSISGVGHSNGVITSGVWSGTAISAIKGGTGLVSYTTGDILYASSSTTLGSIAAGTAGSVLTSAGAGSTPYWAASIGSASGMTLNGLTATTQYFATSIAGSGFTIGSTGSTHTYYIALAGNASTGLISGAAQTIFGLKTFGSGVAITSGTASTNTTTGALTVAGGVGITGQLSVNTIALGTTAVSITPSMIFTGTAGTVITMSVLSDTTLAWEGSSGQLFSIDNNLSSGEIFSVSDISGLPVITASAGQTITLNEFGGFTQVGNGLASTNTTTGALRVIGGVGITGSLYLGSPLLIPSGGTGLTTYTTGDILYASSSTTLARITAGTAGSVLTSAGAGSTPYWAVSTGSGSGITLNGLTATTQTFATSISGSGFTIGSTGSTHTFYIGLAGNASTGLISGAAQTIFGVKTFASGLAITSGTASTSTSTGDLIVTGGAGIAGTVNIGGHIRIGTNTFSKAGMGAGDILFDNGSADTPASLYYWANNRNIGTDVYFSGSGTTRYRIVKELNESGGAELWSIDREGIVYRSAWAVGETINTRMYNYSDLGMSATTTINSTSYTTFATITYTPKSSSSYLWIEFSCTYTMNGTSADDFWSNIEVAGSEIVNSNQVWINGVGGGTRSGVLFPLAARYTNTGTAGIAISIRAKRGTSDDAGTIYGNTASGFMRIQEIGR